MRSPSRLRPHPYHGDDGDDDHGDYHDHGDDCADDDLCDSWNKAGHVEDVLQD